VFMDILKCRERKRETDRQREFASVVKTVILKYGYFFHKLCVYVTIKQTSSISYNSFKVIKCR